MAAIVLFVAVSFDGTRGVPPAPDQITVWHARLAQAVDEVLSDPDLAKHHRDFIVRMAATTMAQSGHADHAVRLVREHLAEDLFDETLTLISASQSAADDVPGALRTIEQITDKHFQDRGKLLIAARQAQRGDTDDALALLGQIIGKEQQDRALELIIKAELGRSEFQQAEDLTTRVRSPDIRQRLVAECSQLRGRPTPDDANYVELTVARAKQDSGIFGLSEREAEFARRIARAEVAFHRMDDSAWKRAVGEASAWISDWDTSDRRFALARLAALCHRCGDQESAQKASRDVPACFLRLEPQERSRARCDDPQSFRGSRIPQSVVDRFCPAKPLAPEIGRKHLCSAAV